MPKFGKKSQERLYSCHSDLIRLFEAVVVRFDCTILEGHRGKEQQNRYYNAGKSKVQWPDGKHNNYPSEAVDVAPYPIIWPHKDSKSFAKDLGRWYMFVGFVRAMAISMGIKIRTGADWDGDFSVNDQTFDDLPHFELKED